MITGPVGAVNGVRHQEQYEAEHHRIQRRSGQRHAARAEAVAESHVAPHERIAHTSQQASGYSATNLRQAHAPAPQRNGLCNDHQKRQIAHGNGQHLPQRPPLRSSKPTRLANWITIQMPTPSQM